MIGTYKEFYKFVSVMAPFIKDLWADFNNRPDPKEGDMFRIMWPYKLSDIEKSVMHTIPMIECKFIRVDFDHEFKNGVAFYYVFDNKREELKIHSINDVYDIDKLRDEDHWDLFGFWTHCEPLDKKEV